MNLQITHTIGGKNPQPLFVNMGHDSTFEKFKNLVSSLTKTKIESVRYEDEDGDLITVETEPEFEEIKKLGSRQVKVFVDASPLVVEKPKPAADLISFTTTSPKQENEPQANKPAPLVKPKLVIQPTKPENLQPLPHTMEALANAAPAPHVRVFPCRMRQVHPAPAFKVAANVIKPTPVATSQPQPQPVHNAYCDNCNATIVGLRYKCANCLDYDLCEKCEAENVTKNIHHQTHIFLKIRAPIRSGVFTPLPNLYECHRPFGHFNHASCQSRLNALEAKVNALLAQNNNAATPSPAPVPVPAVPAPLSVPVKTPEEKLEERRQKREKARQEREAKREQRILLKQKKIQEKQEAKQKLQAAQAAAQAPAPAPAAPQLNLNEIPVVLKVEEVKAEAPKAEAVEATVTIEEVEDEFHQQVKDQPAEPTSIKIEEVAVEKKEEKVEEVAEDFVKVNKEEDEPNPYAAQLQILQDMGFSAVDRLSELLKQFNGDLQAVLQSILENL